MLAHISLSLFTKEVVVRDGHEPVILWFVMVCGLPFVLGGLPVLLPLSPPLPPSPPAPSYITSVPAPATTTSTIIFGGSGPAFPAWSQARYLYTCTHLSTGMQANAQRQWPSFPAKHQARFLWEWQWRRKSQEQVRRWQGQWERGILPKQNEGMRVGGEMLSSLFCFNKTRAPPPPGLGHEPKQCLLVCWFFSIAVWFVPILNCCCAFIRGCHWEGKGSKICIWPPFLKPCELSAWCSKTSCNSLGEILEMCGENQFFKIKALPTLHKPLHVQRVDRHHWI